MAVRQRNALYRQAEDFFHRYLLGLYSWDQCKAAVARKVDRLPGKSPEQGKFHDEVRLSFGPFELEMLGPFESDRFPCGRICITCGQVAIDGPIDEQTWKMAADFIKLMKEQDHGRSSGADWGH
jgi:hypothetical protein